MFLIIVIVIGVKMFLQDRTMMDRLNKHIYKNSGVIYFQIDIFMLFFLIWTSYKKENNISISDCYKESKKKIRRRYTVLRYGMLYKIKLNMDMKIIQ